MSSIKKCEGLCIFPKDFVGYFDRPDADEWNEGLGVMLDVTRDGIEIDFEVVKGRENGSLTLATDEEKAKVMRDFAERNATMADGTWRDGWLDFVKANEAKYMHSLCFDEGISEKQYQRIAHYIDCEAHRDVVMEIFKTYNYTNELD